MDPYGNPHGIRMWTLMVAVTETPVLTVMETLVDFLMRTLMENLKGHLMTTREVDP